MDNLQLTKKVADLLHGKVIEETPGTFSATWHRIELSGDYQRVVLNLHFWDRLKISAAIYSSLQNRIPGLRTRLPDDISVSANLGAGHIAREISRRILPKLPNAIAWVIDQENKIIQQDNAFKERKSKLESMGLVQQTGWANDMDGDAVFYRPGWGNYDWDHKVVLSNSGTMEIHLSVENFERAVIVLEAIAKIQK